MRTLEPLRSLVPGDGRPLVCPYCYSRFTERHLRFRCTGRPGPEGLVCEPVEDDAIRAHLGRRERLPPVFAADGRRAHAVCPECSATTGMQVCSTCHAQLPVNFGRIRSRMIALVGARDAGKTVFMTVLIHELMNRVGSRFNASVGGSDDHTRHRFHADYETPLYGQSRLLGATRRTGVTREPLVFGSPPNAVAVRQTATAHCCRSSRREDLTSGEGSEPAPPQQRRRGHLLLDPLRWRAPAAGPDGHGLLARRVNRRYMLGRVTDLLMSRPGGQQ